MIYLWLKAGHIIFVIFWMAGLFMLPRLFVYHQETAPDSPENDLWVDRERKLLKKINETIEKIDDDDYGFCEACGVEIGIRRLEARPTATLCVDCKTLAELKEKQLGG